MFFLSYLISDFDNEIDTALAAYNAGRARVKGWLSDPSCSEDLKTLYYIPYTETRNYVEKVNKAMSMYQNLYFQ
ncbi:hypothetical protein SDC9_158908 [bioreactor metagenome]|uniref:Transglycosylase SLT domain-containing protein n=1 Tax=bioreactor metagenome TaxID=1076179 RepID=A0A645FB59_9ZZZZ